MYTHQHINRPPLLALAQTDKARNPEVAPPNARRSTKQGQARILDEAQVNAVLSHIRSTSHSPESDEVKFLLSVRAGLRVAEIAGMTLPALLDAEGKIGDRVEVGRHIGKGRKARSIPMHTELKAALVRLQRAFPQAVHVSFSKRQPRRVQSTNAVNQWFAQIYRELGLVGCSSHSGRRTFITNLARIANETDYSLRDVQKLAGHARLDTTALYIDPAQNLAALVAALGTPRKRAA